MKLNLQPSDYPKNSLRPQSLIKKSAHSLSIFWARFKKSIHLMARWEKRLALFLVLVALVLSGMKYYRDYINNTKPAPAAGGIYREAFAGELKYLNPILAQSDTDKAVSHLIFPGLVKFDKNGIYPDIAERWEVGDNGQKYIFFLRKNVIFHNGVKLTAADVVSTINKIKATENDPVKSPLYDAWRDVTVTQDNDYQVTFQLPKPYGPFMYNADFGILPESVSAEALSNSFIGAGSYQFVDSKLKNGKITQINLKRYKNYYGDTPYLDELEFSFYSNEADAVAALQNGKVDGLFGADAKGEGLTKFSYPSAKQLGFIFNLRNDKFKDKETRRKILAGEAFPETFSMRVATLDSPAQRAQAGALKEQFAKQNIKLDTLFLNPVQLKDVVDSRDFETLLYGFNFRYDPDWYLFWHSSQVDRQNFAGYGDKNSDILLEDARMAVDGNVRNAKYAEFMRTVDSEHLAVFYPPIEYKFYLSSKVKGFTLVTGVEASSHFDNIAKWYVKEKRVKK